jgi:hypothetical protein
MLMLFVILTVMIGVSATTTHMQYVNAASNDGSTLCRHHDTPVTLKRCSPFLLPFP